MTEPIILRHDDIAGLLTPADALEVMDKLLSLEADGRARQPVRTNIVYPGGWFRVMPGALLGEDDTYTGLKVMNLSSEGLRYLILLFSGSTGELLALMDAALVTASRTAAMAAAAARRLLGQVRVRIGVFGSGYEAQAQLRALAGALHADTAVVYSPNPAHRSHFSKKMSEELSISVIPVESAQEAAGHPLLVLATKTDKPVLQSDWVAPGAVILSIGSTRPEQREIDTALIERATAIIADHPAQVMNESGDFIAAAADNRVTSERLIPLAQLDAHFNKTAESLILYKSTGTSTQDLALAVFLYQRARRERVGESLAQFPWLKSKEV